MDGVVSMTRFCELEPRLVVISNSTCRLRLVLPIGASLYLIAGCESPTERTEPIIDRPEFTEISAGTWHTCAVSTEGDAYCWGESATGTIPSLVEGGLKFDTISVGSNDACGITRDASAYCWHLEADSMGIPMKVETDMKFQSIGAGYASSRPYATTRTGLAIHFSPDPPSYVTPYWFDDIALTSISSGGYFGYISHYDQRYFGCGVSVSGDAHCWGDEKYFGEREEGETLVPGGLAFTAISADALEGSHVCGIVDDRGAYCWGSDTAGELGTSEMEQCEVLDPTRPTHFPPKFVGCSNTPVAVDGGISFSSINVGGSFTCGVATDGTGYCWGANRFGNLGNGSTTLATVPTRVSGDLRFSSISAGTDHACGITIDGAVYCWGRNNFGQLGNGGTENATTPVRVW